MPRPSPPFTLKEDRQVMMVLDQDTQVSKGARIMETVQQKRDRADGMEVWKLSCPPCLSSLVVSEDEAVLMSHVHLQSGCPGTVARTSKLDEVGADPT